MASNTSPASAVGSERAAASAPVSAAQTARHTAALARLCAPRKPQDVAAQASPHSPPKQAILPGGTDPSQQQQQEERLPQEQACGSEASTAAGGMATASGSASARGMVQRRRRSFQAAAPTLSSSTQQQQQQQPPAAATTLSSSTQQQQPPPAAAATLSSSTQQQQPPAAAAAATSFVESSFFPSLDQTRSTREAPEAYAAAAVAAAAATEPSRGEVLAASSYCNAQRRRSSPSAQTPPATLRFAATADGFALRARAGSSGAATIETAEAVIPAELRGVQGFLKEEDDRRMASAGSKQLALAGAACSISYGKESPSRCSAEARASNMTSEETPPTRRILGRTPPTEFRAENHRSSGNLLKGPDMLLSWCSICPECAAFYREA
ncbi:fibrous sheath CABYR-binding protein-like [Cyclospora cayetanensis]|uniref:Fibrous sheath CABYR-binding protein-like n=1 Tax=Cyclospora cayetanensis TaxID=88456 RepID=A0A6P6RUA2_9EIME|nr:fibrous sheath CABYR-binding protein-like [Cyclospora cayetanensis]